MQQRQWATWRRMPGGPLSFWSQAEQPVPRRAGARTSLRADRRERTAVPGCMARRCPAKKAFAVEAHDAPMSILLNRLSAFSWRMAPHPNLACPDRDRDHRGRATRSVTVGARGRWLKRRGLSPGNLALPATGCRPWEAFSASWRRRCRCSTTRRHGRPRTSGGPVQDSAAPSR